MKKHLKTNVFIALLLVLAVASVMTFGTTASAADTGVKKTPQYGGTLIFSDSFDGVRFGDPSRMARSVACLQLGSVAEALFRFEPSGNPVGWLVKDYKFDPAAKTYTFSLIEGVKFQDGTDFNAAAVKWNLDRCIKQKTSNTQTFKSVDIIDEYTVRLNLKQWDNSVPASLALYPGYMISPTAYEKAGKTDKERSEWTISHPVGTGPFEVVSYERNVKAVFKKWDGYRMKGKPYLDGVEFHIIQDTMTRQMALRSGEVDIIGTLTAQDIATLEREGFVTIKSLIGCANVNMVPNSANPDSPWSKLKVRQAAQHAVNVELINKSVLGGLGTPSNQLVDQNHWAYNPDIKGYPYDPEKAKKLLAEAGYPNGFKTKLQTRVAQAETMWQAVCNQLKAVGIDAEFVVLQSGDWDQKAMKGGGWEGLIMGTNYLSPDVSQLLYYRYGGDGSTNYKAMLTPEDYLKAVRGSISAPDFETKKKLAQEALKLMTDKYCLQLNTIRAIYFGAYNPKVHNSGWYQTPFQGGWTPEEAWIEQ